jgi:hypothetical protein
MSPLQSGARPDDNYTGDEPVSELLRDPRYLVPLAILVAVLLLSVAWGRGNRSVSGTEPADPTAGTLDAGVAPPSLTADGRRSFDLSRIRDALAVYRQRYGGFPGTANVTTTLCAQPTDAGCALGGVVRRLRFADGAGRPYWYVSDGATYYALIAASDADGDPGMCPTPLPVEVAGGPVMCVRMEAG